MSSTPAGRLFAQRYQLQELVGRGGMGAVWRAQDLTLGREVALKLLGPGGDARRVERFRREAALMARVVHPGVVRLHEVGQEGEQLFLVCELVAGARTLDVAAQGQPWKVRVGWVRDAARALGAAHAQGIAHRDVKPANLLVDRDGRLRVTDFGLAASAELERLTRTGELSGTPWYMAPEQLEGRAAEQGPPCDVWALGAVLWEVLTGEVLFAGESLGEVVSRVLGGPLPRLRERDPSLPAALDPVLARTLARDPAGRLPDGEALARALDAVLAGKDPELGGAPGRRAAPALAVGLLGALALGAALLAGRGPTPPAISPTPPPSAAPRALDRRQLERALAAGELAQVLLALPEGPLPADGPWEALATGLLEAAEPGELEPWRALLPRLPAGADRELLALALVAHGQPVGSSEALEGPITRLVAANLAGWEAVEAVWREFADAVLGRGGDGPVEFETALQLDRPQRLLEELDPLLPSLPARYARALVDRVLERLLAWDFLLVETGMKGNRRALALQGLGVLREDGGPPVWSVLAAARALHPAPRVALQLDALEAWCRFYGRGPDGPSGGLDLFALAERAGQLPLRSGCVLEVLALRERHRGARGAEELLRLRAPAEELWPRAGDALRRTAGGFVSVRVVFRSLLEVLIDMAALRAWREREAPGQDARLAQVRAWCDELERCGPEEAEFAGAYRAQLLLQEGRLEEAARELGGLRPGGHRAALEAELALLEGRPERVAGLLTGWSLRGVRRGLLRLSQALRGEDVPEGAAEPAGRDEGDLPLGVLPWRRGPDLRAAQAAARRGWRPGGSPLQLVPGDD